MHCLLLDQAFKVNTACKIGGAGYPYGGEICLHYHTLGVATKTKRLVPELCFTFMLLYTDIDPWDWIIFIFVLLREGFN